MLAKWCCFAKNSRSSLLWNFKVWNWNFNSCRLHVQDISFKPHFSFFNFHLSFLLIFLNLMHGLGFLSFFSFLLLLLHWISSTFGLTLGPSCSTKLPCELLLQWIFYSFSSTNSLYHVKPLSPIKQRLFIINHKIA